MMPASATVWLTAPSSSYGVVLPSSVTVARRNAGGTWQAGTAARRPAGT